MAAPGSWRAGADRAELAADDLHGDLARRVRPVVAGPMHLAAALQPVAFGQHGDRLGPCAAIALRRTIGRHVPLVGAQRTARRNPGRERRCALRG